MLINIVIVLLIFVSLPALYLLLKKTKKDMASYTAYPWAAIMLLCAFLIKDNYVFNVPQSLDHIAMVYIIIPIAILFILPRYVPLRFVGFHGKFNGIVMYPIFEEVAFRGLILPLLLTIPGLDVRIDYVSLNGAIIISALLFGLMHILSYGAGKAAIRVAVSAFIGGLFMGYIAWTTQSILLSIAYHMAWNSMLAFHSKNLSTTDSITTNES